VHSVTIGGQSVHGTFKQPVTMPVPASSQPAIPSGQAATPTTTNVTSSDFTMILPIADDPNLLPLLQSKGVQVSGVDTTNGQWLLTLLGNVLPILFLVGLMLYLGRQ